MQWLICSRKDQPLDKMSKWTSGSTWALFCTSDRNQWSTRKMRDRLQNLLLKAGEVGKELGIMQPLAEFCLGYTYFIPKISRLRTAKKHQGHCCTVVTFWYYSLYIYFSGNSLQGCQVVFSDYSRILSCLPECSGGVIKWGVGGNAALLFVFPNK